MNSSSPQQAASSPAGSAGQYSSSPERQQPAQGPPAGQPGASLAAILETQRDSDEDAVALQEQVEADNEERRQIGGGLLKQVTIKSGYLLKKGERRKTWKKRYFVLRPDRLCYYKDDREYQILQHIAVSEVHACAQVEVKKHDFSFGIVTPQRTFYVKADSAEQADDWVKQINRARKEIEKQKKDGTSSVPLSSSDGRRDSRAVQEAAAAAAAIPASHTATRPIAIQQAGVSGSPMAPHSSFGQSYTDTSVFSTSESSNAVDHFLSSSYASNSSGHSWHRMPHFLHDRLPIDVGRTSETEDMYDESAGLHRNPIARSLPVPNDRNKSALSSSEEDEEVDDNFSPQSPPAAGSLKNRLHPERVVLSGYLMKQGKRKNWRKRWFVLTSDKLLYARSHMDSKAHRCINLDSVLDAMEIVNKTAASEAGESAPPASQKKSPQNSFKIITPKRTYIVCAPSEEDEIKWISSIRVLLSAHRGSPSVTEAPTPPHPTPALQVSSPSLSTVSPSMQPNNKDAAPITHPTPAPTQYCSIESQLELATGRLQHLST